MPKATYTHDAVATIGEYTDRQTGEKKKRYLNVGRAFTADDGRISVKMDCVPVGPEWSGWISLYPAKDREQPNRAPQQPQARPTPRGMPPAPAQWAATDDDDIPF